MTLTGRDKKLLIVVGAALLIVGFWFLILSPKMSEIGELNDRVDQTSSQLEATKGQLATGKRAETSYAADYSEVVKLGKAVPQDEAVQSLLVQLDALAGNDVEFTEVEVKKYPNSLLAPSNPAASTSPPSSEEKPPETTPAPNGSTETTASNGAGAPSGEQSQSQLPFEPLQIKLQFQANFFKLHSLLNRMEELVQVKNGQLDVQGRLLFIEGFKIKEGRDGFPKVSVDMSAIAFAAPDLTATGNAPASPDTSGGVQQVSNPNSTPQAGGE